MTFRMPDSWEQEQEWREEKWRQKKEAKRIAQGPKPRKKQANPVPPPQPQSLQIEPAGSRGGM